MKTGEGVQTLPMVSTKALRATARRFTVILLVLFMFAQAVADILQTVFPRLPEIVLPFAVIWLAIVLIHVFWFTRKALFSYLYRAPNLSKRGLRQVVVIAMVSFFLGVIIISALEKGIAIPEAIEPWCWRAWAAIILVHIWLNRRPFFSYLGKAPGLAAFVLNCLLLCTLVILNLPWLEFLFAYIT
jgi:hypothetical protein